MQKVYIVQVLGWGDDENAFYNTGVYSSRVNAETAQRNLIAEALEDGLKDVVTNIEEMELDA